MVVKVDRPNTCCVSFDICEANQGGALAQVKVELTEVKEEYTAEEWAQWYADWADWAWYEEDDGQQQAAEPVEPEPEYVDVVTSETEDEAYEPPKGPVKAKQRPTPPPAPPAKHAQVFMAPPPPPPVPRQSKPLDAPCAFPPLPPPPPERREHNPDPWTPPDMYPPGRGTPPWRRDYPPWKRDAGAAEPGSGASSRRSGSVSSSERRAGSPSGSERRKGAGEYVPGGHGFMAASGEYLACLVIPKMHRLNSKCLSLLCFFGDQVQGVHFIRPVSVLHKYIYIHTSIHVNTVRANRSQPPICAPRK